MKNKSQKHAENMGSLLSEPDAPTVDDPMTEEEFDMVAYEHSFANISKQCWIVI